MATQSHLSRPGGASASDAPPSVHGWYPNPDGSDSLRWWDGDKWCLRTSSERTAKSGRLLAAVALAFALAPYASLLLIAVLHGSGGPVLRALVGVIFLGWIMAMILGLIARVRLRPGQRGRGLAVAAIAVAGATLVVLILIAAVFVIGFSNLNGM